MLLSHFAFLYTCPQHPLTPYGHQGAPSSQLFARSLVCPRSPSSQNLLVLLVHTVVPLLLIEAAKCLVIFSVPHMDGRPKFPNVLLKPLQREKAEVNQRRRTLLVLTPVATL